MHAEREQGASPEGRYPGYYISFDPPSSINTIPNAINAAGTVRGYYLDANSGSHCFVRGKMGNITSFDAPGASRTFPTGIRPNDDIVGYFVDQNSQHGFVRDHTRDLTTFDVPGVDFTGARSVNLNGEIMGTACCVGSLEFPFNYLGYVRDHQGSVTTFYRPSGNTSPFSINASKAIRGVYIDPADSQSKCFLRSPAALSTTQLLRGWSCPSCML